MKNIIDLRKKELMPIGSAASSKIFGEISPEQQTTPKPFAVVIVISFVLIGLAHIFFQNSILAAIFFFLISLIILIFIFKEKKTIFWEITRHGVTIGASFFSFHDLQSFWIEYQPESIKEISLKSKKWYQGYLKIPLHRENPLKIRETLLEFLPEERHEDTLIETISRNLGI